MLSHFEGFIFIWAKFCLSSAILTTYLVVVMSDLWVETFPSLVFVLTLVSTVLTGWLLIAGLSICWILAANLSWESTEVRQVLSHFEEFRLMWAKFWRQICHDNPLKVDKCCHILMKFCYICPLWLSWVIFGKSVMKVHWNWTSVIILWRAQTCVS